jgi:hypothetical protein
VINSGNPVQIYNVIGLNIGSFTSQRKAGIELGVSHTMVDRYGKTTDAFFSPALGMMVSVSMAHVKKPGKVIHPTLRRLRKTPN